MQPSYQPPRRFSDFMPDYINGLAQQYGCTYIPIDSGDGTESSLYNNPKTSTAELYKLQLEIEGLRCEYYTADFTPAIYADMSYGVAGAVLPQEVTMPTRMQVQVFSIDLPYAIENLYVESRTNVTLNNILGLKSVVFRSSETVRLEGDFNHFFRAYVPSGEELNAFTILAPNIMLHLLADGGDYDFEFSGSKIYFYKTFSMTQGEFIPLSQAAYGRMLTFGIKSAQLLARASRPAKLTDTTGIPEMWELYGMSSMRLIISIALVMGGFLLLATSLLVPLFWPIGIIIGLTLYAKYRRLLKKREKLVREWDAKRG